MNQLTTLSIIIVVPETVPEALLHSTLTSASIASEVLIADAVGGSLAQSDLPSQVTHLPLLGCPDSLLRYRGALTASSPWILFLNPGETLPTEFIEPVRALTQPSASLETAYVFPRQIEWQGLNWRTAPVGHSPELVNRQAYLENTMKCQSFSLRVIESPIELKLSPQTPMAWLENLSGQEAIEHLESHGGLEIRQSMSMSWLRETLGMGLREGILRGALFHGEGERIKLFIRAVRAHLKWFKLYGYLASSPKTL